MAWGRTILRTLPMILLAALFALGGCATSSTDRSKEAELFYQMGVSYFNEGQVQAAYVQLQKALQIEPKDKGILNSIGLVHLALEEYGEAAEFFERAVALDPGFSDGFNNLGVSYMKLKRWEDAMIAFRKALSNPLYQTPERAYYNLGMCLYRSGEYEQAVTAFRNAARRAPLFPLPYYGLALSFNKMGRYGDASLAMAKALEADPSYKGDRKKFVEEMKQKLLSLDAEDEADLRDYLEIVKY